MPLIDACLHSRSPEHARQFQSSPATNDATYHSTWMSKVPTTKIGIIAKAPNNTDLENMCLGLSNFNAMRLPQMYPDEVIDAIRDHAPRPLSCTTHKGIVTSVAPDCTARNNAQNGTPTANQI